MLPLLLFTGFSPTYIKWRYYDIPSWPSVWVPLLFTVSVSSVCYIKMMSTVVPLTFMIWSKICCLPMLAFSFFFGCRSLIYSSVWAFVVSCLGGVSFCVSFLLLSKVVNRGLCSIAQAESLRYKLLGGLAVRRYSMMKSALLVPAGCVIYWFVCSW